MTLDNSRDLQFIESVTGKRAIDRCGWNYILRTVESQASPERTDLRSTRTYNCKYGGILQFLYCVRSTWCIPLSSPLSLCTILRARPRNASHHSPPRGPLGPVPRQRRGPVCSRYLAGNQLHPRMLPQCLRLVLQYHRCPIREHPRLQYPLPGHRSQCHSLRR